MKERALTSNGLDLTNINSDACNDAVRSGEQDDYSTPLGLTFVLPKIRPDDLENITDWINVSVNQLKMENSHTFWAFCAPGRLRNLYSEKYNFYYPMVILLANVLSRGRKALK